MENKEYLCIENKSNEQMNLKENLKALGWTSVEVADKMGITKASMSQIVNGNPTIGKLQEIADVIGVSLIELIQPQPTFAPKELTLTINGKVYTYTLKDEPIEDENI